jgi:thiazole biosynthesis enzyme
MSLSLGQDHRGSPPLNTLAEKGFKVVVYERRLSFGGGIGGGGNLIPKIAVQKEVQPILDDFGIRYKKYNDEVFTLDPAELIAKLSAKALDAGAKIILGANVDDVIVRDNPPRVVGVLWHWTAIQLSGLHVDPIYTQAKLWLMLQGMMRRSSPLPQGKTLSLALTLWAKSLIGLRLQKGLWLSIRGRWPKVYM